MLRESLNVSHPVLGADSGAGKGTHTHTHTWLHTVGLSHIHQPICVMAVTLVTGSHRKCRLTTYFLQCSVTRDTEPSGSQPSWH